MGYAGGTKDKPSYYSLGDHTETVDLDYDPEVTDYDKLLKMFWNNHNPTINCSRQYMSGGATNINQRLLFLEDMSNCLWLAPLSLERRYLLRAYKFFLFRVNDAVLPMLWYFMFLLHPSTHRLLRNEAIVKYLLGLHRL